jgi:hypothetical protein
MGILKKEFNAFKEKQEALNENLKERFVLVETSIQGLSQQIEEYNENTSTENQIQSIRSELVTFSERLRSLEASNQSKNSQIIVIIKKYFFNMASFFLICYSFRAVIKTKNSYLKNR